MQIWKDYFKKIYVERTELLFLLFTPKGSTSNQNHHENKRATTKHKKQNETKVPQTQHAVYLIFWQFCLLPIYTLDLIFS